MNEDRLPGSYPVADIFFSIQGEGHFVGSPMVFVRLAGCTVRECHIRQDCDESPWKMRERLSKAAIVERVTALHPGGIACITGGEPTDHDLLPLISALQDAGMRVHLETSGVRSVAGYPLEWLTVSPKLIGRGPPVQRTGHVLKVVVRPEWGARAWDYIDTLDAGTDFFHRYLQPLTIDEQPANLQQVIDMILNRDDGVGRNAGGRWALSTQAHRSWGLK